MSKLLVFTVEFKVKPEAKGEIKESIVGGRHYYKFERRDGLWKISHLLTLNDWN